jgi:hypothetical protein
VEEPVRGDAEEADGEDERDYPGGRHPWTKQTGQNLTLPKNTRDFDSSSLIMYHIQFRPRNTIDYRYDLVKTERELLREEATLVLFDRF